VYERNVDPPVRLLSVNAGWIPSISAIRSAESGFALPGSEPNTAST
jgi:hypothetical protein